MNCKLQCISSRLGWREVKDFYLKPTHYSIFRTVPPAFIKWMQDLLWSDISSFPTTQLLSVLIKYRWSTEGGGEGSTHTCPVHSKCVESSVCIDKSSWQKSCREIHEVILTGSWQTLQEVWLQSPEMVILREWGVEMSSSRHDSTRVDTTRYFQKSTRLYMAKNALADKSTKEMKQEAMQCIPRSVNLCRQMTRFK